MSTTTTQTTVGFHRRILFSLFILICALGSRNEMLAQGAALFSAMEATSRWQPGWAKWSKEPGFVNMRLDIRVKADMGAPFSLIAGSASVTETGVGCSDFTDAITVEVPVKIQKPFEFRILGSNIYEVSISLAPPPSTETRAARTSRGKPVTPAQLKVYVDGVQTTAISHVNTNFTCSQYITAWNLELSPDKNASRQNSLGRDAEIDLSEDDAPGNVEWPEIGPGKNELPGVAPIRWSVGLGRLLNGKSAGRLRFLEMGLSSNAYTPAALTYHQPIVNTNDVEVYYNIALPNDYVLRQIKAPQAVIDIPTNTVHYTEMRFYLPMQVSATTNSSTGCYDILTNSPFVTWKISNPDLNHTVTRRLQITEIRAGLNTTNEISYDSTNKIWLLTRGHGSEQYRETRAIGYEFDNSFTNDFLTITNRFETNRIADGLGNVAYEAVETYTFFPWGWDLASVVVDPSGSALTTTYHYGIVDSWPLLGRLKRISYPDGSWEERTYGELEPDGPVMLTASIKPIHDTSEEDWVSLASPYGMQTSYYYNKVYLGPEEWFINDTLRILTGEGVDVNYRYDTFKKDWVWSGLLEREAFQIGWLPDCMGSMPRDGALRFSIFAAPEAAGWPALTLTNYHIATTNTYDYGTWSAPAFTAGSGSDWRRVTISGLGTLYDGEAFTIDELNTIPNKSVKHIEIRRAGVPIVREFHAYSDSIENGTSFSLVHRDYHTNDALGQLIGVGRVDAVSSASRTLRTVSRQGTNLWPIPLVLSESDATGITYNYTYDSLRRLKTATLVGANGLPDQTVTYTYDACNRILGVVTNSGSLTLSNQYVYDRAGRITRAKDLTGAITVYSYPDNGLSTSVTLPGGATQISTKYLDGEPKSTTGTAVVHEHYFHEYLDVDVSLDLYLQKNTNSLVRTTYLGPDGTNSTRKTVNYFNLWNSPISQILGGYSGTVTQYVRYHNSDDNPTAQESAGFVADKPIIQGFSHDSENHNSGSWQYVNYSTYGIPEAASLDRLTQTFAIYTNISGSWYRATNTYTYQTDSSATPTLVSSVRHRLSGLASGVTSEVVMEDPHSNTVTTTVYVDRANKKVTEVSTSTISTRPATNVVINGLLQSQSTMSVAAPTRYTYDALRRLVTTTSPTGASTTSTFDSGNGRAMAMTDFAGNTTSYEYYPTNHLNSGRVKCVTTATGKKTYYEYTARGELYRVWGDVPYPEERIYNDFGELVELRTFRAGTGWNGTTWPGSPGSYDSTTWTYQPHSGLLLSKTDAAGRSVTNSYYVNGYLHTRTWARGTRLTNYYSIYGDLFKMGYNDTTPIVTYTNWNRAGQPRELYDASGKHQLTYDYASRLVSDYCPSGLVAGVTILNHFHPQYGRDYIEVQAPGGTIHHDYTYDTYGRLDMVSNGSETARYGYLANSDRLETTTYGIGYLPVAATVRTYELGRRLTSIRNVIGTVDAPPVTSHRYLYDAAHRRTQATLEDGSLWKYDYNDRDELSSGRRHWADWSPVSGQRFEYAYDNIGNRTSAAGGGDVNGANLRTNTYSVNSLNQYTSITTPGYKDVIGVALATNGVTVNSGAADRKGEYYHREISIANGSTSVWQAVTVSSGGSSSNGGFAFPRNVASPTYDYDGNLTYDAMWYYSWDGENRLKEMSMNSTDTSTFPATRRQRLQFAYDQQGRRIQKIMARFNGSSFTNYATNRFVYDGWNLIAELDHQGNPLRSYAWGQDLSGTMNKAGGVGGLLLVKDHAGSTAHFAGYDGNGNVTTLIKSDGSVSARYEYSPFGESLRVTGSAARLNPFRWSTKFTDEESALVYYGYRYYSPALGRWVNRDPIEERGGVNLYGFCRNAAIIAVDSDGREYTLTGLGTSMAVGGGLGGLSAWVTDQSIWNGVIAGAAGGAAGYTVGAIGASLAGGTTWATGAFAGAADGLVSTLAAVWMEEGSLQGVVDSLNTPAGMAALGLSTLGGGLVGGVGGRYADLSDEDIWLDLAIAVAGTIGVSAAGLPIELGDLIHEKGVNIFQNRGNEIDEQ